MKSPLNSRSPESSRYKIVLLVFAFSIIGATLWYTHTIVRQLEARQKQVADLYAKSLEFLANSQAQGGEYSFVFDQIIRAIDFPVILTDRNNEPIMTGDRTTGSLENAYKNLEIDTTLSLAQQYKELKRIMEQMDAQNAPIHVTYQDTIVLNYLHYGESSLVTQLRWLPYVEILLIGLFILIGYISFSYVKRTEQSNIWVGMARETAHQLGTPISSMLGWVELFKERVRDPSQADLVRDMENDLQRLQKIADRFSKIGSKPDLKSENLNEVISKVLHYFQRRIPQSGKSVQLVFNPSADATVPMNRELFEWVMENLIKNGLDAIETGVGTITIVTSASDGSVFIDVTDTGKGVDAIFKKDIFRPGFSTKARGWGLGLSLSQRIIETYHSGRLTLRETGTGTGTTFRVMLKK